MMRTTIIICAAACALMSCLEQNRRVGNGADTTEATDTATPTDTSDAADATARPDVAPDTVTAPTDSGIADADVVPDASRCAGKVCDDQDPCTSDRCDEGTGQCVFTVNDTAPVSECSGNADCVPTDPCLDGACVSDTVCGVTVGTCEYTEIVNCGEDCTITGCDDGTDCTIDVCRTDGTCTHALAEGCLIGCDGDGVTPVTANPAGGAFKAAVSATPDPTFACTGGGQSCRCDAPMWLTDGVGSVAAEPAPALATLYPGWGCSVPICSGDAATCRPMLASSGEYWVWGTRQPVAGGPSGDANAPLASVRVTNFCIAMNDKGLRGSYLAKVVLGASEESTVFGAVISHSGGEFAVSMRNLSTNILREASKVEVDGPKLTFNIVFPLGDEDVNAAVTVYSNGNTLTGTFTGSGGAGRLGSVQFERLSGGSN